MKGVIMKEYKRDYPIFSLCGLNCGLCPRYHTDGASKCPGCGGTDFYLKHPSCKVINCNLKRENVEFCFECSEFPCEKYIEPSENDSFITYVNVLKDFEKAKEKGTKDYIKELNEKMKFLNILLENYNDGRRKKFYCLAINLLDLANHLSYRRGGFFKHKNRRVQLICVHHILPVGLFSISLINVLDNIRICNFHSIVFPVALNQHPCCEMLFSSSLTKIPEKL
jgi:hypothetical protein